MNNNSDGFTLIELLVVIGIIGILSTLAVVGLNVARQRSRDAKRVADIKQLQTSLELGFTDTGSFPNGTTGCGVANAEPCESAIMGSATATALCNVGGAPVWMPSTAGCGALYMGRTPSNPIPNGAPYLYLGTLTSYQLIFNLEGNTGQLQAGYNCLSQTGIISGQSC